MTAKTFKELAEALVPEAVIQLPNADSEDIGVVVFDVPSVGKITNDRIINGPASIEGVGIAKQVHPPNVPEEMRIRFRLVAIGPDGSSKLFLNFAKEKTNCVLWRPKTVGNYESGVRIDRTDIDIPKDYAVELVGPTYIDTIILYAEK